MIIPLRVVQALAPWIVKSRARAIDLELYDFILGRNLYLRIPNIVQAPMIRGSRSFFDRSGAFSSQATSPKQKDSKSRSSPDVNRFFFIAFSL